MGLFRDNETNKSTWKIIRLKIQTGKEANQWALMYKRGCRFLLRSTVDKSS